MQTQITVRHFDASPELRDYAIDRLSKLERYYDGITDAHIILTHDATIKAAEISLNVYRHRLAAHDEATTHEEAIDRCIERLRKQILRYKSKLRSVRKDSHR